MAKFIQKYSGPVFSPRSVNLRSVGTADHMLSDINASV